MCANVDGTAWAKSIAYATRTRRARPLRRTTRSASSSPFPTRRTFAPIRERGGPLAPVIDRSILGEQIGGRKVYFAQEVEIEGAERTTPAKTRITPAHPSSCSRERPSA